MSSPEPLCGALAGFILVRFLVFWIIANRFPNYRTAWTLRPEYSEHDKKDIIPCYNKVQAVDKTKIRYEQKVAALLELNLISEGLADDLVKLYEYRNTVHIEAEMKKKLVYDLSMGELAYRRVEGLSIEVSNALEKLEST